MLDLAGRVALLASIPAVPDGLLVAAGVAAVGVVGGAAQHTSAEWIICCGSRKSVCM